MRGRQLKGHKGCKWWERYTREGRIPHRGWREEGEDDDAER